MDKVIDGIYEYLNDDALFALNKDRIKQMLKNVEIYREFGGGIYFAKVNKMRAIIYGAGNWGRGCKRILEAKGLECACFVDKNKGGQTIDGIPTYFSFDEIDEGNYYLFICIDKLEQNDIDIILDSAKNKVDIKSGFYFIACDKESREYNLQFLQRASFVVNYEEKFNIYRKHKNELIKALKKMYDEESVLTIYNYLRTIGEFINYNDCIDENLKYFFGKDKEEIYEIPKDGAWLNTGSSYGDTVFKAIDLGVNFDKIISVEAEEKYYCIFADRVKHLKLENKIIAINEYVDERCSDWDILKENKISLVNADIEGYELALLKGLKWLIVRDRPVLAICAYHRPEDIWTLLEYVSEIVEDYYFVFRKYAGGFDTHCPRDSELLLYAVPKEKIKRKK